jgi:flagellar basal-body rod protein FlgB
VALFTDLTTAAVERALSGVAQRQRLTADNVANVTTPGYKAKRVEFEDDLALAMSTGDPSGAQISETAADTPVDVNGNNVDLQAETTTMIKSGLQYDALVATLNYKLSLIRDAIGPR